MPSPDNKAFHRFLVDIAALAVRSFYSKVHIIGEENVAPLEDEPLIVYVTLLFSRMSLHTSEINHSVWQLITI